MSNKVEEQHGCPQGYDIGLTDEELDALAWVSDTLNTLAQAADHPSTQTAHIAHGALVKIMTKCVENHSLLHEKDHELQLAEEAAAGLLGLTPVVLEDRTLN